MHSSLPGFRQGKNSPNDEIGYLEAGKPKIPNSEKKKHAHKKRLNFNEVQSLMSE
jgi:hypothetical protein